MTLLLLGFLRHPNLRAKHMFCIGIVDVRTFYERLLERGKCKMAALGAAMRKLAHICFGVINNQTDFQPQTTQQA